MEGSTEANRKVINLVVDSAGFLKNVPLKDLGENIYTDEGVVGEIKDKATKERLQVLPYELHFKRPSAEDIKFVTEFTKKTGDYYSLSAVDLRVIALTYHLEKEFTGGENIRDKPSGSILSYSGKAKLPLGFYIEKEKKPKPAEEVSKGITEDELPNKMENLDVGSEEKDETYSRDERSSDEYFSLGEDEGTNQNSDKEEEGRTKRRDRWSSDDYYRETTRKQEDDDDDEDEGWVTVNNIKNAREKGCDIDPNEPVVVACLTTDYAIQNVLIQLGLKVVSVDGMLIRTAKMYILRCYACFKTTMDMTKKFCPHCGNSTLRKTSYSVDEDGTVIYYMSKKPPNKKGLKYSLPMPKGGKYSNNPVLCADQRMPQQRTSRKARATMDPLDMDYIAGDSPFVARDINSRAVMHGFNTKRACDGGRRNPNENRRKPKKK